MIKAPLNQADIIQRAKEVLDYYPETGEFVWIKPPKVHPRLMNQVAGGNGSGYTMIKIDGQKYKAHRLAWLFMTGEWPESYLDHKDGNPFNNKFDNLRLCDQSQNNGNRKRNFGKLLPKGVRKIRNRYQARIKVNGKAVALGTYSTPEEAQYVYIEAAAVGFGEFARPA